MFSLNIGAGHRVADGEGACLKIHGFPPQANHLPPPQTIEGGELDDELQPVAPCSLKQFLHFLSGVEGSHVLLRLGPLHLVHRVAGDKVQLHRIFQSLVHIGVQPDDTGGFQGLQLMEIEALDVPGLQAPQGDTGRLEVGDNVIIHIKTVP